jgi:hypothetical protein
MRSLGSELYVKIIANTYFLQSSPFYQRKALGRFVNALRQFCGKGCGEGPGFLTVRHLLGVAGTTKECGARLLNRIGAVFRC